MGGGHCDAAICTPVTGRVGEIWSSKRCATVASISRSALMRTSAAVARSTTSSLVKASAPRLLSRRANSCTLIICSLILGLLMIHRNPRFGQRFLRPRAGHRGQQRCQQLHQLLDGPQLFGELIAWGPAGPSRSVQPMLPRDAPDMPMRGRSSTPWSLRFMQFRMKFELQ